MGHGMMGRTVVSFAGLVVALAGAASVAVAQDYDFDWVTIGDVGNTPYLGDSPYGPPYTYNRGGVDYEYRIGRTEVTTAQWMEFVNTFSTQSDDMANFSNPRHWGAMIDATYDGPGRRYVLRDVESAEMLPVGGISWREGGMFANWLHNGKSSDLSSLESGAYDTSTWGDNGPFFTDDPTHLPGARFWIPTLDEALKAMNYDPDRFGVGEGGWWLYPHMSDEPPIPGLPGEGTTTAGMDDYGYALWDVPLGAYSDQRSPWGLLDTTGGVLEWTEEVFGSSDEQYNRALVGAPAGDDNYIVDDHVSSLQSRTPGDRGVTQGIRIVTTIPTPSTSVLIGWLAVYLAPRRRRTA